MENRVVVPVVDQVTEVEVYEVIAPFGRPGTVESIGMSSMGPRSIESSYDEAVAIHCFLKKGQECCMNLFFSDISKSKTNTV